MKNISFWFKTKLISRHMKKFDKKAKITRKAHKGADNAGHSTFSVYGDFGRTLQHYAPIHTKLLEYAKNGIKGKRILHLASATGVYTRFLQEKGAKAIALDRNKDAVKIAKKIGNERVVRANAEATIFIRADDFESAVYKKNHLPFKKNCMDFVVSDHFLFSDYDEIDDSPRNQNAGSLSILSEIHRVLAPEGIAIIHFPEKMLSDSMLAGIRHTGFEIMETSRNPHSRDMSFAVLKKKN